MDRVIRKAMDEVGYLEKNKGQDLYDTRVGGEGNYTKYWAKLKPSFQGQPWCLGFLVYCFNETYGADKAKKLLCIENDDWVYYTPTQADYFRKKKRFYASPMVGDIIFFKNSERICHVGLVYRVYQGIVYAIEGNTSSGSEIVPNGGGVYKKSYYTSNSRIAGYGRPDYSIVAKKPKYNPNTWSKDAKGWWYADTETTYLHDTWADINRHRYYFDSDGYAVTGRQMIEGKKYFFEDEKDHKLECALCITDKDGAQTYLEV